MSKRGQVSAFVIIGVVLVVIVALLLFVVKSQISPKESVESVAGAESAEQVKNFIQSCVEDIVPAAIFVVGSHGGYYKENNQLPLTKELMEGEIAKGIKELMPECVGATNFYGSRVTGNIQEVNVFGKENSVAVGIHFPLVVVKEGKVFNIKEPYIIEVPIRLGKVLSVADTIMKKELHADSLDLMVLLKTGMDVAIIDEEPRGYAITDYQSMVKDIPFTLAFEARK